MKDAIGNANIVLLDVRTDNEVRQGIIPGAKVIDIYDSNFKRDVIKLDKNKQFYVYCKAGVRSRDAMRFMMTQGFKNIKNYKGGFDDWKRNKGPIMQSR
jgi:phage shock protein E